MRELRRYRDAKACLTLYLRLVNDSALQQGPAGACVRCGGVLSAAHMLTRTYEVDRAGHWTRRLGEFVEDVVVVCRECGAEQDGRICDDGSAFTFVRSA